MSLSIKRQKVVEKSFGIKKKSNLGQEFSILLICPFVDEEIEVHGDYVNNMRFPCSVSARAKI